MFSKPYKNWWFLLLKGIFTSVLGILIFIDPSIFLRTLVIVPGIILGIAGISMIVGSFSNMKYNYSWTWWLFEGLLDLLFALIIISNPIGTIQFIAILLGIWILIMGFIHIATAVNIQYYIPGNLIFVIIAALLVTSGTFFLVNPLSGMRVLMKMLGVAVFTFGLLQLYASFIIKKIDVEEIEDLIDF